MTIVQPSIQGMSASSSAIIKRVFLVLGLKDHAPRFQSEDLVLNQRGYFFLHIQGQCVHGAGHVPNVREHRLAFDLGYAAVHQHGLMAVLCSTFMAL